ncbi:LSP1 [[Candida] subhashii]|uniref:LSP1 n=1 Tax=[Candida] subhashii TaxID=561895 RepID=A0A8J5Q5I3_9ASCO|nr:LSP1 [[Candida] subhashii]KAG7660756.1 LSP1 [[Candida] subhashii]
MHRTYSLRGQKAPTAAQLQSPPPPPSTTKNRFFGGGGLSSSIRKAAAGATGPELSRKLAQFIKMEKNFMRSLEVTSRERRDVAKQLSAWGEGNDDDVSDVTDKLGVLIYEIAELEDQYIDKYDQYRITLKGVRDIESSVQPSRERKQKITDDIAHLKYKDPQSPKIPVLEQELVRAEAESLVAEAQLSNITRERLKAAFNYQFDATRELAEKYALIAGYGKALLELLDDSAVTPGETRPAYDGYEASKQIIIDAENALASWTLDSAAVKPTLSLHQEYEDDEEGLEHGEIDEEVEQEFAKHDEDEEVADGVETDELVENRL